MLSMRRPALDERVYGQPDRLRGRARRSPTLLPVPAGLSVAWTPLMFGGNDLLAWGVNAILFGSLLALGELIAMRAGRAIPMRAVRVPAILFGVAFLWAALQIAPFAPEGLRHPAWDVASEAIGVQLGGSVSVYPFATKLGLVRLATAACVFWICLQAAAEERGARILAFTIAIAIAAYAAYGLTTFALTPGKVLWIEVESAKKVVTSTFISRNHFSTYAGLGVIIWVALWSHALRQTAVHAPWRYRLSRVLERTFGDLMVYMAGALVCAVALLLTGSRAGILSTCFGLSVLFLAQGRASPVRVSAMPALFVLAGIGGLLYVLFGDVLNAHLSNYGLGDVGRVAAYQGEWRAILARPVLGYGYSTFVDVFPPFRTPEVGMWGLWDRAHNTYMDLVIGLGLPGGAALAGGVAWIGHLCWRGAAHRKSICFPAVSVAALALVGLHATVDFSLEIQGVTLTLMGILAVGAAQSLSRRETVARNG